MDDVILTDSERSELKEIIARMRKNEPCLTQRQIGPVKVIKYPGIPKLSLELLKAKLKSKRISLLRKMDGGIILFKENRR